MNYAELARQGDPNAIAYLINRNLQPKGITAIKVEILGSKLRIMLRSDRPIEDAIVQHVCSGAKKLNIPNVGQVEVLREQPPKPSNAKTIVEPQKAAVTQSQSQFLEDVLQEIKKPERRRTLILAGGLMATLLLAFNPFSNPPKAVKTTSSAPSAQDPPTGDIGKTDEQGNTVTVNVPSDASCHRTTVSVKLDTFNDCLVEGMTYVQVANVLGYRGTLQSQSGSIEIYQWSAGSGQYLSASFVNGRLRSKSQIGLGS